jgi:hypothetical protein
MRYLYKRGKGAKRRVMHLCGYDPRTGQPTMDPLCRQGAGWGLFDTTCNFPLGQPVCKRCSRMAVACRATRPAADPFTDGEG